MKGLYTKADRGGRVMKKKKDRKPLLPWLVVLIALVAAGLVVYFVLSERAQEKKRVEEAGEPERKITPDQEARTPLTVEKEPIAPATEEAVEKEPADAEDHCSEIEDRVQDFLSYLNKEAYVQDLVTDKDIYERFETLMQKLSSHPPIPAGEGLDSLTMTKNVYHFYRVLDEDEIRLIKQILKNEADSLEINLETFFQWLLPADPCPDLDQARPSLDVLYQYAGFLLNTIGGRAYLFRRSTPVRLLTSYYALLIVHEADKRGKNTYGIDIFPEISRLAREISAYPDFQLQNIYIHQLMELQNYYLERR
jgi:flagellar basal body-associated protein FliL